MIIARNTSAYSTELLDYFKADGHLRNGDITKLYHRLIGKQPNNFKGAYRFGSLFDYYYTERELFISNLSYSGEDFVLNIGRESLWFSFEEFEIMVRNADALDKAYPNLRKFGTTQEVIKGSVAVDNQKVKAKIRCDFWFDKCLPEFPNFKVIVDLKTTTAQTKTEYMDRFFDYDYDRNGAFYLDVAKANIYLCLAVNRESKIFDVFVKGEHLVSGRKKYQTIISKALKEELIDPSEYLIED